MTSQAVTGSTVTILIRRLLPFGLLVGLEDGRSGIIREREIAWDRNANRHWREHFTPGERLQALVLGEGREQQLELSLRLAQHDPWSDLPGRYRLGQVVDGVVTGVRPYGVFIEIEPGITGLLHRSRLSSWAHKAKVTDLFWPGDRVKTALELIDPQHRRLRLSLGRAWLQRWQSPESPPLALPTPRDPALPLRSADRATRLPLELPQRQLAPLSILITEDDQSQLDATANWLRQAGQQVCVATSAEDALLLFERQRPDLVLMDFGLPGINGIQAIQQLLSRRPEVRCVLMTDWARANEHLAELERLRSMGVRLLIKPFLPEDLVSLLFDILDGVDERSDAPSPPSMPVEIFRPPNHDSADLDGLLAELRAVTHAVKVVLFVFDPAQRCVGVLAEDGPQLLQQEALGDLIYSPVRDVAEDQLALRVEDTRDVEGRVRYLRPLLTFRSCLGLPLLGEFLDRYALFLFWSRERAIDDVHEAYARAVTMSASALLERELFRARAIDMQRLALLGQLSRALVHEINHQLSPISFALRDLEEQYGLIDRLLPASPDAADLELRQARDTLGNLSKGVRRLTDTARLFGRMTIHTKEVSLSMNTTVEEVVEIVRDMADRAHVTIEVDAAPALYSAHTPAAQVQQILLNIVINAIQQINLLRPELGGSIRIRMGQELREQRAILIIQIEDDGPGIHRRLWERIFDLGFTTRSDGGSGMGLYITRGLVGTMGGRVYVAESAVLWGTTVIVELPAMPQ
jgi:signal transduction histidine kinase/DNA-binding response OmpR family regulator/predicted RNA-binding protein with RPS1 domain